jgi:hypothetical protein
MSTVIANVVKQSVIFKQIASFLAMTILTPAQEKDIGSIPARSEYFISLKVTIEVIVRSIILFNNRYIWKAAKDQVMHLILFI